MAVDLREYTRLKESAERAQQAADRAAGVLAHLQQELLETHGCRNPAEAENKIKKLKQRRERLQQEFEVAVEAFREEYEARLGDEQN